MKPINQNFLQTDLKAVQNDISKQVTPSETQSRFATALKDAINEVNNLQTVSDQKTNALVSGDINDLHEVMIASQKQVLQCKRQHRFKVKLLMLTKKLCECKFSFR
ncbi:flagellar hook-basal body complex protein FliE [Piscibacillus salipiscarius]|uniref:flagellar hook-basal body complex protein FliE n=1 Tax=Piscibacillus salipiscarius TaxID=299480 RepID=UPI0024367FE0|nr:flagellar hook-basal body complex protein FliE [Piscibacillus salipiscarius]